MCPARKWTAACLRRHRIAQCDSTMTHTAQLDRTRSSTCSIQRRCAVLTAAATRLHGMAHSAPPQRLWDACSSADIVCTATPALSAHRCPPPHNSCKSSARTSMAAVYKLTAASPAARKVQCRLRHRRRLRRWQEQRARADRRVKEERLAKYRREQQPISMEEVAAHNTKGRVVPC